MNQQEPPVPGKEKAEGEITNLVEIAREVGQPDSYAGKRNNLRFSVGERLDICFDPRTPASAVVALLHNISDDGAAFWLKSKPPIGTKLFIRQFLADGEATWTESEVRHCTQGIQGWLVGVCFKRG